MVAHPETQSEATVDPPRREQRELEASRATRNQRYYNPLIVRFEATKRSRESSSYRVADKQ